MRNLKTTRETYGRIRNPREADCPNLDPNNPVTEICFSWADEYVLEKKSCNVEDNVCEIGKKEKVTPKK